MVTAKELVKREQRLAPGHRTCTGCAIPIVVRNVLAATKSPVVASCATGCLEVTTTIYPFSSWKVPFIHNAFENSAATISGVESAYNALKRKGKIKKDIKFIAFGGDGGTYDIGLQSLSGAAERGHNFVYVCYDNGAYMNTGIQRSGGTPYGAATTTTPAGKVHPGKEEFRKDLTEIMVSHHIPYVAQAAVHDWQDLYIKAEKAFSVDGPAFINVFTPCTLGWGYPPQNTIEVSKLAVNSKLWPLYEVEDGKYKLNYEPSQPIPIEEFLKTQKRFTHLFTPENQHIIEKIKDHLEKRWDKLKALCDMKL